MSSLRGRLAIIVAGLALLAVAAVTVIVALTTNDALEETLAEQREAREIIVGELNEGALEVRAWSDTEPLALDLAEEFQTRIVLTDVDGRLLVDTGSGDLPPLEGVIDPFGVFAEFTNDAPFDIEIFDKALAQCFDEAGVPFLVDDSGNVFSIEDAGSDDAEIEAVIEDCYEEAALSVEFGQFSIKEPALLFLGFTTTPSIPWMVIAGIAALIIGGAALVAVPLSGFITRPLGRLAAAARQIHAGHLDVRVDATKPTEVADLAASFNEMSQELTRADVRRKQLTADVAHELRSPLTNILSHLDAIEDRVIEADPNQIRVISSEAVRLAHLVDDLQTMAALDEHTLTLQRTANDPCEVVDMAIRARTGLAIERDVAIERRGTCDRSISIDRTRADQIVGNLLDNALEHTPAGGTITVGVSQTARETTVEVIDTGPGVDPEILPYVFDRLSRGDRARSPRAGGRGLGLAIARGLARTHGGDLTAQNLDVGGACFVLTIPHS